MHDPELQRRRRSIEISWATFVKLLWSAISRQIYRRRLRRVIAAPPSTLPHHLRELCEHLDPPDAEANIQKNPVKNVLKKVGKHDFSGIGATVEKNTKNDAQNVTQNDRNVENVQVFRQSPSRMTSAAAAATAEFVLHFHLS